MDTFLEFDHVIFSYRLPSGESIAALKNISFSIQAGEYVCLIGANGSGKTTAAKLMNGLLQPDSGRVLVKGISTADQQNLTGIFTQVGLIFQNPRDQIIASVVEEDTAFGPENLCLPTSEILQRVDASLRMSGASHLKKRQTYLLSAGETQRVALAGVLALQPSCLVFDETTAMLDPVSRAELLNLMKSLNQQGFTIIHITHDLDETLAAERILVLSKGELIKDGPPQSIYTDRRVLQEIDLDIPILLQVAQDLQKFFPQLSSFYSTEEELLAVLEKIKTGPGRLPVKNQTASSHIDHLKPYIEFAHVSHTYLEGTPLAQSTLRDITFAFPAHCAVGLVGHTGSGKSTLLQHMNGLIRPQQGKVRIGEFELNSSALDVKELRRKVGLVFQNPEAQFFETYVGDEIAYGARMLGYQGKLREVVRAAMEQVGLDFEHFIDRPLQSLSGGEKRRVALASYLVIQPQILLLDEPFAGLDPKTHREMVMQVNTLKKENKTIILSTHNMRDLIQITDEVVVLQQGHIRFNADFPSLFAQDDLHAWSLDTPLELKILTILRNKGMISAQYPFHWESILKELSRMERGSKNALL